MGLYRSDFKSLLSLPNTTYYVYFIVTDLLESTVDLVFPKSSRPRKYNLLGAKARHGLDDDSTREQKRAARVRRKKTRTGLVTGWGAGDVLSN
jgi:hypothetical protein